MTTDMRFVCKMSGKLRAHVEFGISSAEEKDIILLLEKMQ
jgi:hypothetical protein